MLLEYYCYIKFAKIFFMIFSAYSFLSLLNLEKISIIHEIHYYLTSKLQSYMKVYNFLTTEFITIVQSEPQNIFKYKNNRKWIVRFGKTPFSPFFYYNKINCSFGFWLLRKRNSLDKVFVLLGEFFSFVHSLSIEF